MRAQQLTLLESKGEYVIWAADDGVFLKDGLKICLDEIKKLEKETGNDKIALITRYQEEGRDRFIR